MKPILFFKDRPVPYYLKDWEVYIENHNVIPKLEKNLEKYKGKKILLYGKGLVTKAILKEKPEIINYFYAISDKKIGNYCEASNYPTKIPPTEIKNHKEIDLIFVSVYRYDIIKKYLKKLGVKTKTIKII